MGGIFLKIRIDKVPVLWYYCEIESNMMSNFVDRQREQEEFDHLCRMAAHAGLRLIGVQMGFELENPKVVVENPITQKTISIIYDENIETRLAEHAVQPKPEPKISEEMETLQRIAMELSNVSAELNALCVRRKQP